jgi:hypothetical protein
MAQQDRTPVTPYVNRLAFLKTERQSWEPRWRDLVDFLLPHRGRFIPSEANNGKRKDQKIIDNTGVFALNVMASAMMSYVTSPARPWFKFKPADRRLEEIHAVRVWLDEVELIVSDILIRSNFYHVVPLLYTDLGGFGTSAIYAEGDVRDVVRFSHFPVGSFYLANDERGQATVCFRELRMTTDQLVRKFGYDACSSVVRDQYDQGKLDAWHDVVWCLEPRRNRKPSALGADRMPYRAVWYEAANHQDKFLLDAGYEELPVMAPRWQVTGEDAYGIGPGADVLGDLKELQMLNRTRSQSVALQAKPPLQGPGSLNGKISSLLPGGIVYHDGMGKEADLREIYKSNLGLSETLENIQDVRMRVKRGLFEDLFLMFAQSDRREITAAEIRAREQEKVLVLGRVLESLNQELLDPVINRVYGLAWRAGLFPPAPQEAGEGDIRVEYTSVMAQALRGAGMASLSGLLEMAGAIGQVDQSVLDVVDSEASLREAALMLGSPAKALRSPEDVAAIRENRAQAQQQQAQVEQAAMAAKAARDLGSVNTTTPNALTDLAGIAP